jgi:hypothetical protein
VSLTLDDIERFGPVVAFAGLIWKGSSVVTKLETSIVELTKELKLHADWRAVTEARLVAVERVVAVETAVDDVEKKRIEERLASVKARRAVRETEHQHIDRAAIESRKKKPR